MPAPFTGMALDRASAQRKDPAWVARLLGDRAARTVAAGRDGVLVAPGDHPALRRLGWTPAVNDAILLGLEDGGRALFALDLDAQPVEQVVDGATVMPLREAGSVLPRAEAGLAAYLVALLNWHRRHRFCANCGAPTDVSEAGHSRHCARCATTHFPRTDPVVIMTVEHAGRLLLGRRAGWPPGRLSLLAGFVSPGESAEEAVVREVREESGIVARDPAFVVSQPWPFPASLMLGFEAFSDGGEPHARDGELEEVHWLEAEAVRAAACGEGGFALPPRVSVARLLIDRWLAQQRPQAYGVWPWSGR